MATTYCIVVNDSDGSPLNIAAISSDDETTVRAILEHVTNVQQGRKFVRPKSPIKSIDTESALKFKRANNVSKLRGIRSDWRDVLDHCLDCPDNALISTISARYEDTNDMIYFIVFCDLREEASPHPITMEPYEKNEHLIHTEHLGVPEAVYNGRPAELAGPSITIYHPIFAEFKEKLSQPPSIGSVPLEDLQMASSMMDASAMYFPSELHRQVALQPAIEHFLKGSLRETTFRCGKTSIKPDGHRVAECGLFKKTDHGRKSMLSNYRELENGVGQGEIDPTEQAEKGFALVCTAPQLAKLREVSFMPAFLLGIAGPYVMVSGAIYLDGVVSQRLTNMISLIPESSSSKSLQGFTSEREKLVYEVAHLFNTLGACLDKLDKEYLEISPQNVASSSQDILVPAPHFTSFHSDSRKFTLTYRRRVFDSRSNRAVFLANAQSGTESAPCIVKFTSRYCKDAHKIMETADAAPKLLYCEFDKSVGKYCVVMEHIQESVEGAAEDIVEPLRTALANLHAQSYVFGDLRSANVLVDTKRHPYLIDFDWSGIDGTVYYPCDLDLEGIKWANGVEGGGPIIRRHDEEMLQILIDDLRKA
ncbi:hypothetical protein EYR36_002300 [Pleurotus pulmonarius]|nr:hypothetical protein EYR36_002300 [Pleurotus pulmonarius]